MVDFTKKWCGRHTGCTKYPSYGVVDAKNRELCSAHKRERLMNVAIKRLPHAGCATLPKVGFAASNEKEWRVDATSKRCRHMWLHLTLDLCRSPPLDVIYRPPTPPSPAAAIATPQPQGSTPTARASRAAQRSSSKGRGRPRPRNRGRARARGRGCKKKRAAAARERRAAFEATWSSGKEDGGGGGGFSSSGGGGDEEVRHLSAD